MALDDAFAESQSNSCAGILFLGMEPLEYREDPLEILWIDSYSIVGKGKDIEFSLFFRPDGDAGRSVGSAELEGISHQILEELHDLHRIPDNPGKRTPFDYRSAFPDSGTQVFQGMVQSNPCLRLDQGPPPGFDARNR